MMQEMWGAWQIVDIWWARDEKGLSNDREKNKSCSAVLTCLHLSGDFFCKHPVKHNVVVFGMEFLHPYNVTWWQPVLL